MRLAYRKQGLWGLIDHRTTRGPSPTGRADERVVAAVKEALRRQRGRSKGTIKGLMPLVAHILMDRHGGAVCGRSRISPGLSSRNSPAPGADGVYLTDGLAGLSVGFLGRLFGR
ncbi:hypothetical protein [Streptomyces sp. PSAA01]|uniref:hypothetical protein n=1 Tax=Streptomyces sp. PSAA01 TaxID=2912762 RepID=UPI001F378FCC|nr:hypothetical protein [Streptomyces sp. PSAA01]MCG0283973.1 hypothetical protein [Streptomyces sp. PSAA01]